MRKKNKKIKIPKNKDIEEFVEVQENNSASVKNMEDVVNKIENKEQDFRNSIKVEHDETIEKRLKNVYQRKDNQEAERKRRVELLKAMSNLEER